MEKYNEKARRILEEKYFKIEERSDLSEKEKVDRIIKITSAVCAGVAIQPIPFADIFVLTPIQAIMGSRIAKIRGVPVTENDIATYIKEIAGVIGLGLLAQQLVIGAYKTVLPFLGALTTIPLVWGLTYGIGRVMDAYVVSKREGQVLDPEEIKRIWKAARKEGEKENDDSSSKEYAKKIR